MGPLLASRKWECKFNRDSQLQSYTVKTAVQYVFKAKLITYILRRTLLSIDQQ